MARYNGPWLRVDLGDRRASYPCSPGELCRLVAWAAEGFAADRLARAEWSVIPEGTDG